MSALPIEPTEHDRERFRDAAKQHLTWCDFNRTGIDGEYKDAETRYLFKLWWSVERERQLLQNLNQSQGCKISELARKLEKAQMEIEALSTENGFVHQHAEEDKQELREHLEVERKRLDWALKHNSFYDHTTGVFFCDPAFKVLNPQVRVETDEPRTTIDELIAGEKK